MANRKHYIQRPAMAIGSQEMRIFFGPLPEIDWLRSVGAKLERVVQGDNGEVRVTLVRSAEGRRVLRYGDSGEWLWRANNVGIAGKLNGIPRFNSVHVNAEHLGDRIILTVPADRPDYTPQAKHSRKRKAAPANALATVKETVAAMAKESPPPDFKPAIPLREAIDTINAYKVEEGGALNLIVSKRGRLRVEYGYGG